MKKYRWQLIIIFLTGFVVGILLLGEQPGRTQVSATPRPSQGGIYTEALIGSMQRLNPLLDFNNSADRDMDRLIFSGLLKFDSRGLPEGDLAESWGISQDGTIYNFTLRENALWHDGQPVTSDDVIFTISMLKTGGGAIPADLTDFWKRVEVKGSDKTIQFRLPEAFAPFLDYLTFGILPRHLLADSTPDSMANLPFNLQPVGSGPFQFERLIVSDNQIRGIVLKSFKDYYGAKSLLSQVVFLYYPDTESALQAYRDQRVQGISEITLDSLQAALENPDLAIYTGRKPELTMILFNLKNPEAAFLQDVEVRKALAMAINRQWILDRILGSQAMLADGPIFPGTWASYNDLKTTPYDEQAARTKLIQAGYVLAAPEDTVRSKNEVQMKFTMLYPDDGLHKSIAEAIQRDWAKINVQVDLAPASYSDLINQQLKNRSYQAAMVDLNLTRSPDPDPYPFWDQVQATGGQNYSQWDNRMASEYLEQARVTTDIGERSRLYRNFQIIFSDEQPAILLYYPVYSYGVSRQVQGISMGPLLDSSGRFATILNWYLISKPVVQTTPTAAGTP
ncbi:MAG: ABC transporter substrate-binding protein [Anaerolineaceae bacterium]